MTFLILFFLLVSAFSSYAGVESKEEDSWARYEKIPLLRRQIIDDLRIFPTVLSHKIAGYLSEVPHFFALSGAFIPEELRCDNKYNKVRIFGMKNGCLSYTHLTIAADKFYVSPTDPQSPCVLLKDVPLEEDSFEIASALQDKFPQQLYGSIDYSRSRDVVTARTITDSDEVLRDKSDILYLLSALSGYKEKTVSITGFSYRKAVRESTVMLAPGLTISMFYALREHLYQELATVNPLKPCMSVYLVQKMLRCYAAGAKERTELLEAIKKPGQSILFYQEEL